MGEVLPIECERTRQSLSAGLDGELSQLERVRVAAHVARCPGCRTFQAHATSVALDLRAAPLEKLCRSVQLPRAQRPVWALRPAWWAPLGIARLGTTAAVTVTVILVAVLSLPEGGSSERAQPMGQPLGQTDETNALVVQVRRPSLASGEQKVLAYGTGGIGAYKPPLAPTA